MESLPSIPDDETFFQGLAGVENAFFLRGMENEERDEEETYFMEGIKNPERGTVEEKESSETAVKSYAKPNRLDFISEDEENQPDMENEKSQPNDRVSIPTETIKLKAKVKRTPLGVLNGNQNSTTTGKVAKPKSPKVVKTSTPGKKKSVKTDKEPKKPKSTSNGKKKEPAKRKSTKKENESSLTIYEDSPNTVLKNTLLKRTNFRASYPEQRQQPTVIILPRNRKLRYSLEEKAKVEPVSPLNIEFGAAKIKPLSKPPPTAQEIERSVHKLETLFPKVDPEYLKAQYIKLKWSMQDTIEILLPKEDTGELPSREDYVNRKEIEKLHNKYWENFTVENYLKLIPDPWQYFLEAEKHNCYKYANHSFHFLKNKFKKHYSQVLQETFIKNDYSLYLTCQELKKKNKLLKMRGTNRSKAECDAGKPTTFEIQFLHEVALVEYETQINVYLKKEESLKLKRYQLAEKNGELYQCMTCRDYLLPVEDVVGCSANHVFCVDCVVRYVKVEIAKEDFQFKCLKPCKETFSKYLLQEKLGPLLMASTIKRISAEKNKPKGIENLINCPFCYHIVNLPSEIVMLQCLNPVCMMESCRYCKQPSQTHSKCTELERLELDKTEENPIDPCVKCLFCNKEFIQENDSVQIICSCGAVFCSICQKPFPECEHLIDKDFEASTDFDYDYNLSQISDSHKYNDTTDTFNLSKSKDLYNCDHSKNNNHSNNFNINEGPVGITYSDYDSDSEDFNFEPEKTPTPKFLSSDDEYIETTDSICF